jgi:S-methylmethionine-dependent homocysteine/selenocysteine methylase
MSRRSLVGRLKEGEVIILDGATGSELQRRGVDVHKGSIKGRVGVWSASANLEAPETVRQVHEDYLRAGAEIITSNNFYTSRDMMALIGEEDRWEAYTRRGGELAVQARDAVNPEAYVAGGIAPPYTKDLRRQFEEQARVLAAAGVDFMLPEYIGGDSVIDDPITDCVTAVDACATTGLPVFLGVCNLRADGRMRHGATMADLVTALRGHPVEGIFLMCSFPEQISATLPHLREAYRGPIGAYAHLGYDENPKFGTSPDEPFFNIEERDYTPERYAKFARQWRETGAQVIGGCCATGPDHIRAVRAAVRG